MNVTSFATNMFLALVKASSYNYEIIITKSIPVALALDLLIADDIGNIYSNLPVKIPETKKLKISLHQ